MAHSKKSAADHSREYRQRQQEKANKLGIEKITIDMAAGVKAGMAAAMKRNGIKNAQEAWHNLGLFLSSASHDQQDRMLKPRISLQLPHPRSAEDAPDAYVAPRTSP